MTEYTPNENIVRRAWADFSDPCRIHDARTTAEFDRFLARVRRDTARAVLNELIEDTEIDMRLGVEGGDNMRVHNAEAVIDAVTIYSDTEFPEENHG